VGRAVPDGRRLFHVPNLNFAVASPAIDDFPRRSRSRVCFFALRRAICSPICSGPSTPSFRRSSRRELGLMPGIARSC
jgi:hypothetical protein